MLHKQNKFSKVIGSFNLWPPLLHAFPPVPNLAVKVVITKFFLVRQKLREACKRESCRFRLQDRHEELSVCSDVNKPHFSQHLTQPYSANRYLDGCISLAKCTISLLKEGERLKHRRERVQRFRVVLARNFFRMFFVHIGHTQTARVGLSKY
jgi:hypothetical protein